MEYRGIGEPRYRRSACTTIDMDMIQEAVSVQQSLQAYRSFGNSNNTCNKMHASEKSSSNNQGKNNNDKGKSNNNKGKNSNHQGKGNNNKGKSDQKNQLTFVDFETLTGKELLKAVTDRGCCTYCWKKYEKSAACEGKDHVCKQCDGKSHLDKCCAFPKKKQD